MFFRGRIADAGYITVDCGQGHTAPFIYDARKHDLLLQSACLAFLDGYEREATASFAASLERLWEFYIRVVAASRSLDPSAFESTWKQLSRQSERQLGAFLMIYLFDTGNAYDHRKSMIEFRNKVIHQGYIPIQQEAYEYGRYVFEHSRALMKVLEKNHKPALDVEIARELEEIQKKVPGGQPAATFKATLALLPTGTNVAVEITDFDTFMKAMEQRLHTMKHGCSRS